MNHHDEDIPFPGCRCARCREARLHRWVIGGIMLGLLTLGVWINSP